MINEEIRKIQFNYLEKSFYLPSRTGLKEFVLTLFKAENVRVELVNYIFCSDRHLLRINREFLNHDTYTDIITFQYTNQKEPVVSDIYISIDRVRENSRRYQSSFIRELYKVVFHGALHLCGYKDKLPGDIRVMRSKEEHYLVRYVSRETNKTRRS